MPENRLTQPKLAAKLLKIILSDEDHYQCSGDLEEVYRSKLNDLGTFRAKLWYWSQVLRSLPDYSGASFFGGSIMFKNYLKISLRIFRRYKIYSIINITGLSVGIAAAIMVTFYIQFELSYDDHHTDAGSIYRITANNMAITPNPLAAAMKEELPEVVEKVRFNPVYLWGDRLFSYGDKKFYEKNFYLTEPSIFNMFSITFVHGDPETALSTPSSLVITESVARKYFGNDDPLGKVLNYEDKYDFMVSAVIKDMPENTHLTFEILGSYHVQNEFYPKEYTDRWGSWNFISYIKLAENAKAENVEKKLPEFIRNHWTDDDYRSNEVKLQALKDIHFSPVQFADTGRKTDIRFMYFYGIAAVIILLLACMNFANLSTAQSIKRSGEVGLRKVFGAKRKQLLRQFVLESVILSLTALPISILLCWMLFPVFAGITGIPVEFSLIGKYGFICSIILVTILTGVIAGCYPGIFVSSLNIVKILRKISLSTGKGFSLRNSLIFSQFSISVFSVCCMMIISGQLDFIRNKDLGLNDENIYVIRLRNNEVRDTFESFRQEITRLSGVKSVTGFSLLPLTGGYNFRSDWEGKNPVMSNEEKVLKGIGVDHNFLNTFGMEIITGRGFSVNDNSESVRYYILNEAAVQYTGFNEPVGKKFKLDYDSYEMGEIVGVVKDFHFTSLHNSIEPFIFVLNPRSLYHSAIKIDNSSIQETILDIQNTWHRVYPGQPMEGFFYSDELRKMYKSDLALGDAFIYISILVIFLAGIGLFGLTSYVVENKTKEIGIRKILGARVYIIISGISKNFIAVILLSNIIAFPAAYFVMNKWLVSFAYRIDIRLMTFLTAGIFILTVSFLTIISRSLKAANANPVDTLRYE
ncbi:ABC transporter permease [candidate division KSB1 bacterium]